VSSVRLPLLSFLPAIFHVFLGVLISFLHLGHFAIVFPFHKVTSHQVKTLVIVLESNFGIEYSKRGKPFKTYGKIDDKSKKREFGALHAMKSHLFICSSYEVLDHRLHGFRISFEACLPFAWRQETLRQLLLQEFLLDLPSDFPPELYVFGSFDVVWFDVFPFLHTLCTCAMAILYRNSQ